MTTCPGCGEPVTPDLRFCVSCGTALVAACPSCAAAVQPGMRFCGQCGTRLVGATSEPRVSRAAPAPAAEVERRLVSVLFADLVGSTGSAEGRDPEEVREAAGDRYRSEDHPQHVVDYIAGMTDRFAIHKYEELFGQSMIDLYDDRTQEQLQIVSDFMQTGGVRNVRVGVRKKNGETLPMRLFAQREEKAVGIPRIYAAWRHV